VGIAVAAAVGVEISAGALLPQAAISEQADVTDASHMRWRASIRVF
jgi:hypothetical protein